MLTSALILGAVVARVGSATLAPGCYVDCVGSSDCSQRLLSHTITLKSPNMTLALCQSECAAQGYAWAGVEAAYGCFCGNSNGTAIVPAPSSACCSPCTGDNAEFCGAKFRVWVFASKTSTAPPEPTGCVSTDPRDINTGTVMISAGYLDQPYCDVLSSGRWICTITYDSAHEGGAGEHIAALWSDDVGATWSAPVSVEPAPLNTEVDNAYSMTIVARGVGSGGADRTYAIYNMNLDNVTHLPSGAPLSRSDMLGKFVMRYSDDGGATWSSTRYIVPNPIKPIDKSNDWGGNETIMWTVDQTKVRNGTVYFGFTKIGKYLLGPPEELWVMASSNLLTAHDAADITWTLLPDADHGISLPDAEKSKYNFEEAHVVPMTGAGAPGFYIEGRTTTGYLIASETDDATGQAGWTPSHAAQYYNPSTSTSTLHEPLSASSSPFGGAAAGLKNPRGPTTMKRFDAAGGGRYLLLFYNTHAQSYESRNPYWLSAGVEVASKPGAPATILWSQPEVIIYDAENHDDRPGYPDFIEHVYANQSTAIFITETQKTISRLHRIPNALLQGLWHQDTAQGIPPGAVVNISAADQGKTVPTPAFPALDGTSPTNPGVYGLGLALGMAVEGVDNAKPGQVIFDSTGTTTTTPGQGTDSLASVGSGVRLEVGAAPGQLVFSVGDGQNNLTLPTDPVCSAVLATPGVHVYGAVLDGGPRIATVMVDGVLCDGGGAPSPHPDTGWSWFPALSSAIRGAPTMKVTPPTPSTFGGTVHRAMWWTRMLTTSELVGMYRTLVTHHSESLVP
eukprot:m.134704 g.134704  ORF g.134704 m.134704 type:complete len:790 (-) comp11396_c1_seq4:1552-3921(-)